MNDNMVYHNQEIKLPPWKL